MEQILAPVTDKLDTWGETLVEMLPNLIVALMVLVVAFLIARFGRRLVTAAAERFSARRSVRRLVGVAVSIVILAGGLFIALGVLKLDKTVTSLLAGAGVVGLAVGFAAQNLISNLLSGVLVSVRGPFKEGHLIETLGHRGTVEVVDLRVTRLRTPQGQTVRIPNRQLLEEPLVNYSELGRRRVDLEVGVSYDDDLAEAKAAALEAVADLAHTDLGETQLYFTEFGGSSINFVLRFWVPFERQPDYLEARSEAIMKIKRAFDARQITIPFPIRTLDFGEDARSLLGATAGADSRNDRAAA